MRFRCFLLFLCSGLGFAETLAAAPGLIYSTYLRDSFTPTSIATDAAGNIYLAGNVLVDPAAYQTTGLVVKLNSQASAYLYVRYLGGSVGDFINAIAVDSAGNAYVAGSTASPDFPVTGVVSLGTPPTGIDDQRSFVTKLDPNGVLVFSALVGGSAFSKAEGVAVTAAGQVLVSGGSNSVGFPTTPGAYSVSNSSGVPYLLELDPTGTKIVFSATGIGGSSLSLDASGNIYIAGTTYRLDYPTTPGAYQPTFPVVQGCVSAVCESMEQGANQYVTKVDPTGSRLIFSTAVTGNGNTSNGGLAISQAGEVYVTGYAGPGYPYTVTGPAVSTPRSPGVIPALPFLSKLDPTGQTLLFSVPVGGAGVQVDSAGAVYVGGSLGPDLVNYYAVTANLPALGTVPTPCLPNGLTLTNSAYVVQADGTSGNVLWMQFIGGSTLTASAVALVGSVLWVASATAGPGVPFTPGALTLPLWLTIPGAGASLAAADFSQPQPPAGTPQIGCVLDAADLSAAGPAARYQVLSIFGNGIGPSTPVAATDDSTTALGGVSLNFTTPPGVTPATVPAILLYVSANQVNFAVPLVEYDQATALMQLTVNGVTSPPRELPLIYANPHLFLNFSEAFPANPDSNDWIALTLNPDGSVNSLANPAPAGAVVSVFVNGIAPDPQITNGPLEIYAAGGWTITGVAPLNPFVVQVDAQLPPDVGGVPLPGYGCTLSLCTASLALFRDGGAVSPTSGAVVYVTK